MIGGWECFRTLSGSGGACATLHFGEFLGRMSKQMFESHVFLEPFSETLEPLQKYSTCLFSRDKICGISALGVAEFFRILCDLCNKMEIPPSQDWTKSLWTKLLQNYAAIFCCSGCIGCQNLYTNTSSATRSRTNMWKGLWRTVGGRNDYSINSKKYHSCNGLITVL